MCYYEIMETVSARPLRSHAQQFLISFEVVPPVVPHTQPVWILETRLSIPGTGKQGKEASDIKVHEKYSFREFPKIVTLIPQASLRCLS